jgi:HTH-type transcriptional regulator/antitoxin HigA
MDNESRNEYKPQVVSAPGATIADLLEEKNLSQSEFAHIMGWSLDKVENLIKGKEIITHEIAVSLESVFCVPITFWNERERRYREYIAR